MEIKLFGRNIFEFRKGQGAYIIGEAQRGLKDSKYLPDFQVNFNNSPSALWEYTVIPDSSGGAVAVPNSKLASLKGGKKKKAKTKKEDLPMNIEVTPKGVYALKSLNDDDFKLNTDPAYVDQQISDFKDKLTLLKTEEFDMRNGVAEVSSMLVRFENRKLYPKHREFFEQFPYTTPHRVSEVVKAHSNLQLGQVAQFVADMPKEAVDAMKQYNSKTSDMCSKQAVFYVIADKKDFQKSEKRRDPILLAQSPFGHVWQILGAWDEEMLLLEKL